MEREPYELAEGARMLKRFDIIGKLRILEDTAMSKNLTIGEIAQALHCDERKARRYLREVVPTINVYTNNPQEMVDRESVIELCRLYERTLVGRRLLRLLGETGDLSKSLKPAQFRRN